RFSEADVREVPQSPSVEVGPIMNNIMSNLEDPFQRTGMSIMSLASDVSSLPASPQVSRLVPSPGAKSEASASVLTEGDTHSDAQAQVTAQAAAHRALEEADQELMPEDVREELPAAEKIQSQEVVQMQEILPHEASSVAQESTRPASPAPVPPLPIPQKESNEPAQVEVSQPSQPSDAAAKEVAEAKRQALAEKAAAEELRRQAEMEKAAAAEAIRQAQLEKAAAQEALRRFEAEKAAAFDAGKAWYRDGMPAFDELLKLAGHMTAEALIQHAQWKQEKEQALAHILDKLTMAGSCKLLAHIGPSDPILLGLLSSHQKASPHHVDIYKGVPWSNMNPMLRGLRVQEIACLVDQAVHPRSCFVEHAVGNRPADWIRDGVRVEVKHAKMILSKTHMLCSFSGIKIGLFDELWLVIYSPFGLHMFKHEGACGLSIVSGYTAAIGKNIVVTGVAHQLCPREALETMKEKLQNAGCSRARPASGKLVEVDLPEGLKAGDVFHVLHDGAEYELEVPEGMKPGQTMRVKLKDDEELPAPPSISVEVPEGYRPGDSLVLEREGREYEVALPENVKPGEKVKVTLEHEKAPQELAPTQTLTQQSFASNASLFSSLAVSSATSSNDPFLAALKGGPPTNTLMPPGHTQQSFASYASLSNASLFSAAGTSGTSSNDPFLAALRGPGATLPPLREGTPSSVGSASLGAFAGAQGLGAASPARMNTFGGPQRSLPGYPAAAAMTMPNRRSQAQLPARQGMMTPDGCLLWEVRLMKSKPEDRFGFAHFSGYGDFLRARNLLDPGEETPAATPVSTPGRNASKGETRSEFPRGKAPKVLVIREVALEGLLGGWNRAHPGSEVVAYDRIYAVNGKNRVEEMQQELRKSSQVTLRIVRYPQMFAVELRGDGSVPLPIGLQVERPPGGSAPELRVLE
ncbi:unnamed protein product, partial [Effrenium voratum]